MTQACGGSIELDQTAISLDIDHSADDRARADGGVARTFCVASKLEEERAVARRHADHPMSEHPRVMTAEQDVSADDVASGHGGNRDGVAVADGGVHAGAFRPEAHRGTASQRVVDHGAEGLGMSHAR